MAIIGATSTGQLIYVIEMIQLLVRRPWGKPAESGAGALTDFGFTGHYLDRPSGLNLPLYRGYSPSFGRWLSRDPIGITGGFNLYGYVLNDPVELVDPLGLDPGDPSIGDYFRRASCALLGIGCRPPPPGPGGSGSGGAAPQMCRKENKRPRCPPCPPPPPPRIDRVPPSKRHFPCPGDHAHTFRYNQNPETCECFLQKGPIICG